MNPANLEKAKKKILEFQKELAELITEGDCTEVYQMNVQLFSLTGEAT